MTEDSSQVAEVPDTESHVSFEALSEAISEDISPAANKEGESADSQGESIQNDQALQIAPISADKAAVSLTFTWHKTQYIFIGSQSAKKECHMISVRIVCGHRHLFSQL